MFFVNLRIQYKTGKYGPEKTLYLNTFHAVDLTHTYEFYFARAVHDCMIVSFE